MKTNKFNWKGFLITLSIFIMCCALTLWCVLGSINDNANKESNNSSRIQHVETAAALALKQAQHDHAFIYAVCSRFNEDEGIAEKQTSDLLAVEKEFPENNFSKSEVDYHNARAKILAKTDVARKARIKVECNKAMQTRINAAPTLSP